LMGPGIDAPHDRRILRDLLSFAPPGVDEVYALAQLGETLEEARYSTIIVDPAPTGHLLRLLEMPAIAIDWTHRLLRLMLKYKELTSLGDAAAELLAFAKRTKAVTALLHDAERAGLLVVALDEPLVRAETMRLVGAVRERAIDVIGVFWNRATGEPVPLDVEPPVRQFVAPARVPPPTGIDAIRAWASDWRELAGGKEP
jgi:arsenite/tail-anchored protein-transporting ATPase